MKSKFFFLIALILVIADIAQAQEPGNDIKWQKYYTEGTLHGAKFNADGSKIIVDINNYLLKS